MPGDKVALIATARKVTPEEIANAIQIIKDWGFKPIASPNLFAAKDQFAGNDDVRAADLQWALDSPDIAAIIIARGGYGTVRIIDRVNFIKFSKRPKWVVGFSDITVLQSALLNQGYASIHGPMLFNFGKDKESDNSVCACLTGQLTNYSVSPNVKNKLGKGNGMVAGGNLSILYSLAGTPTSIDARGKILFIEDLDEYLYHIDRMMMQLKRSGVLSQIAGLVVGGMSDMKDNAIPFGKTAEDIILEAVAEFDYPVCFGAPSGHIARNLALYFGVPATLSVSETGASLLYRL